ARHTPSPSTPAAKMNLAPQGKLTSDLVTTIHLSHHEGQPWVVGEEHITFDFLFEIARNNFTGILHLQDDAGLKTTIFFNQGRMIAVDQFPMEESLTTVYFLRKRKKLTEMAYRDLLRKHAQGGLSDKDLVAANISPGDVQTAARQAIHHRLGRMLAAKKQTYRLEPGTEPIAHVFPITTNLSRAIFRGIVEATVLHATEELLGGMDPYLNQFVIRSAHLPSPIADLRLEADEQRFWDVTLEKPILLRNLFSVSALSKTKSIHLLYALYFLGWIEFTAKIQVDEANFLPHLTQLLGEMAAMNHYEILHIHWTALKPAIEKAQQDLHHQWSSLPLPNEHKNEATRLIHGILERIDESFRYLSDDQQRRHYRDQLIESHQRSFSAELLRQHAETYLLREDKKQARAYIDMALDLLPGNTEYLAIRAQCK
ncbi:MAG TPA: hypothetical protein VI895_10640, partial [Bdellovibrionota bacterium]|nr:hypothetical protein [Bdellovibrionota bacterium]